MNVPLIMQNGPEWFRGFGTEKSPGTKILAVTGRGRMSGVIEVEMGTTIRTVVEDIADGMRDGKDFKAVQLGGASGTFIAAADIDTPIAFEAMKEFGPVP